MQDVFPNTPLLQRPGAQELSARAQHLRDRVWLWLHPGGNGLAVP